MAERSQPIRRFHLQGATGAVAAEIAASGAGSALTVLFAAPDHELRALGEALREHGATHVVGATASRVLGAGGITPQGVSGFHLPAGRFAAVDTAIEDAATIALPEIRSHLHRLNAELEKRAAQLEHRFAILLVDAEARCEERLTAVLGMELNGIPLIGGSAGDLYFNPLGHPPGSTRLLHGGRALRGAAVLCLVASASPFVAYCHNHYVTSERRAVITDADPARRLVREIDGYPALEVYSRLCGFRRVPTESREFAPFPLMIRIGGQYYARGMQRIYPDGALEFACALEPGLVVAIAHPGDMVARLSDMFAKLHSTIGAPELVIGFDCAARTAFMEQRGLTAPITQLMQAHAVSGFSTLGEQFNSIHANNSFSCIGIGAKA